MLYHLLGAIGFLCILSLDADAEDCFKSVLNRRETYSVASGDSLSLSCIVQHCGDPFTWKWVWKNSTDENLGSVLRNDRNSLTSEDLSVNKTRLILDVGRVSEWDEGFYGCRVEWGSAEVDQGHLMYVNVTAALSTDRKVLHRILVCFAAALFLIVLLGLAFCLRSKVKPQSLHGKFTPLESLVTSPGPTPRPSAEYQAPLHQSTPQPPPRRKAPQKHSTSSENAPDQQKTEVVYADISQDALRQKQRVKQSEQPSTVYSSLRFT